jgi:MSHA biogenesis protein MshP
MCPDPRPRHRSQGGFAVVAAIFLLVILAGLAAYIVTISSAQQAGAALDMLGGRALQAARSGMDWGVARVIAAPATFGAGNCQSATVTPVVVNLSTGSGGALSAHGGGLTVTVRCLAKPYTDGASLLSYELSATACSQPAGGSCPNAAPTGGDYIERHLTTQVMCNATGPC